MQKVKEKEGNRFFFRESPGANVSVLASLYCCLYRCAAQFGRRVRMNNFCCENIRDVLVTFAVITIIRTSLLVEA